MATGAERRRTAIEAPAKSPITNGFFGAIQRDAEDALRIRGPDAHDLARPAEVRQHFAVAFRADVVAPVLVAACAIETGGLMGREVP